MRAPVQPASPVSVDPMDGSRHAPGPIVVPDATGPAPQTTSSWPARGRPRIGVDPRRRLGGFSQVRRALARGGREAVDRHGLWDDLVSTLRRHSVASALAGLDEPDRRVLTLAYLHGLSNREIAAELRVSVSTASHRIAVALGRLDDYLRRSGAWIASIALLLLALAARSASKVSRLSNAAARSGGLQPAAAVAAIGAASVVAVSLVLISPHSSQTASSPMPRVGTTHSVTDGQQSGPAVSRPSTVAPNVQSRRDGTRQGNASTTSSTQPSVKSHPGCGGNPTNAPPNVPVGPRGSDPDGAPVSHPTAGGCGPHAG